jgi:hypothetical protein
VRLESCFVYDRTVEPSNLNTMHLKMNLTVLKNKYAIYKFQIGCILPGWVYLSDFYSITRTKDELSVVAVQTDLVTGEITCSKDWRILKIIGPLDLSLVGVIADISNILKEKRIAIFTISTYDTDYIMVRLNKLNTSVKALSDKGYNIFTEK